MRLKRFSIESVTWKVCHRNNKVWQIWANLQFTQDMKRLVFIYLSSTPPPQRSIPTSIPPPFTCLTRLLNPTNNLKYCHQAWRKKKPATEVGLELQLLNNVNISWLSRLFLCVTATLNSYALGLPQLLPLSSPPAPPGFSHVRITSPWLCHSFNSCLLILHHCSSLSLPPFHYAQQQQRHC